MKIFYWNLSKLTKKEEVHSRFILFKDQLIPDEIKQYRADEGRRSERLGELMNDIRGTLLESPGPLDENGILDLQTTPEDVIQLQRFDDIISWDNNNYLSERYGDSLMDWNNFLNRLPYFPEKLEPHPVVNLEEEIINFLQTGSWTRGK